MKSFLFRTALLLLILIGSGANSSLANQAERRRTDPLTQCLTANIGANLTTRPRDQYIEENLHKKFTTVAQNKRYIKIANQAEPGANTVFIHNENALLKELNDTTQNKNFVTSLNNRYTELLSEKLAVFTKKNPEMEFAIDQVTVYNDFKTSAQAIKWKGEMPEGFHDQLNQIVQATDKEFTDELLARKIVRKSDLETNWFRTGLGDTADRASTAARLARELDSGNRAVSYGEPWVQKLLSERLSETETRRAAIEESLDTRISFTGKPGKRTPSEQVFDLIRKAKDKNELVEALRSTFRRSDFTVEQAEELMNYAKDVDRFSPSLRIAKREIVNLDHAKDGGFTADFLGLGSANLASVASALARADNLDHALVTTREAEIAVTAQFKERLKAFQKIVGDIATCGGDDCAGVPSHAYTASEKADLVERLAANPLTKKVRIAFISEGVTNEADRTKIATQGEDIEKALRKNLADKMSANRLSQLTIAIDMQTQVILKGKVDLVVGTEPGKPLLPYEKRFMRKALYAAVQQINQKISSRQLHSRYQPVRDIYN